MTAQHLVRAVARHGRRPFHLTIVLSLVAGVLAIFGVNATVGAPSASAATNPTVRIAEQSVNGIGTFNFTTTGLSSSTDSVKTTASGQTASSTRTLTGTIGTAASVTETTLSGFTDIAYSCVDSRSAATGNAPITGTGNKVNIPAAAMKDGAAFICTFTSTDAVDSWANTCAVSPSNFDAAGSPTTLYRQIQGAGSATFSKVYDSNLQYNAIAMNPIDNYIYAAWNGPSGVDLLMIGSDGVPHDLGPVTGLDSKDAGNGFGVVVGFFTPDGTFYVSNSTWNGGTGMLYKLNLTTHVATKITGQTKGQQATDLTYYAGYAWGIVPDEHQMERVNLTTGAVDTFAMNLTPADSAYGAAWTYGNGNLGFDRNSGNFYAIKVTGPTTASPTFTLVASGSGPASSNNDGTACIPNPVDLSIVKTGPAAIGAGGTISWTLTVTNNSTFGSSGFVVTDTVPAGITNVSTSTTGCTVSNGTVSCIGAALNAGASTVINLTGKAPTPFNTCVSNTANVAGNEQDPNSSNDSSTFQTCPNPVISFTKALGAARVANTDQFQIAIRTGGLTGTPVASTTTTGTGAAVGAGTAGPVTTSTLGTTYTLTEAASGSTNLAAYAGRLTCTDSAGKQTGLPSNAVWTGSVNITPVAGAVIGCVLTNTPTPDLSISKTDGKTFVSTGDSTTYTVVVRNGANAAAVTKAPVTDSAATGLTVTTWTCSVTTPGTGTVTTACGTASGSGNINTTVTMNPGAVITYTVNANVTATSGDVKNTATVGPPSGTPNSGTSCTSPSTFDAATGICTSTDTDTVQTPSITIAKAADQSSVSAVGQTVNYQFTVTNTGNVTLTNVTVNDTFTAPAGPALVITCPSTSLAAGQKMVCTAPYKVTQADLDHSAIDNSASATGTPPVGNPVTSLPSTAHVTANASSGISIVKTPNPASISAPGTGITYSFVVTNTGTATLSGVKVTDAFTQGGTGAASAIACQLLAGPAGSCTSAASTTLLPGQSATFTMGYTSVQADVDLGSIKNTATTTGTAPSGSTVTATASAVVTGNQSAGLSLVKTAQETSFNALGATIQYTFAVKNTGNVSLSSLNINDLQQVPAGSLASGPVCAATSLAPGASTTCSATYLTTQADIDNGSVNDTATAAAKDPANNSVTSNPSSATVPAGQINTLSLTKSASPSQISTIGQTVTYTFVVTNTGNQNIVNPAVVDMQQPPAGALSSGPTCVSTSSPAGACAALLIPGQSMTFTATYVSTAADFAHGEINDTATATGKDPKGNTLTSNPASAQVVTTQSPKLTVAKSALEASYAKAGDVIHYSFAVTNAGNVPLSGISISDAQAAPAGNLDAAPVCPVTTLAAGDSTICTATYTVKQADVDNGSVNDSAIAHGTPPSGPSIDSPPSDVSVPADLGAALTIKKTAIENSVSKVGDVIHYSFLVTNSGNVTLKNISVTDVQAVPAGNLDAPPACPVTTLAPGASTTCTAAYTVTQADINNGSVKDSATAAGTPPTGPTVVTSPSAVTVPATQSPQLTISKTPTDSSYSKAGDVIHYSFLVKNTGNVQLTNIVVTDTQTTPALPLDALPACPVTSLVPGQSVTCTGQYTVRQADVDNGHVADAATATGTPPTGNPVSSLPSAANVPATSAPAITVLKTASEVSFAAVGNVIHYSFQVTNTGNVTLTNVSVTDSQVAPSGPLDAAPVCPVTTLAPGVSTTCTATYTVRQADLDNGTVKDTATAHGTPPTGSPVDSNPSQATVPAVQGPALSIVKSALPTTFSKVGDVIVYSFKVSNTGNVRLTSISVADIQTAPAGTLVAPPVCPVTALNPGETTTCTATYKITQADLDAGQVHDAATATATPPTGPNVITPPSEVTVPGTLTPSMTVLKTATEPSYTKVGDVIHYSFVVTNAGNQTLKNISVTDTQTAPAGNLDADPVCPVTTLAPGTSTTCTAIYTIAQADLDNGSVNDSAIGHGTPPSGPSIDTPPSDATVPGTSAPALTVEKSASETAYAHVGDQLHYSFRVINTGNVTLKNISVTDTQIAPAVSLDGAPVCPVTTLAPGTSTTCTATYTVRQADLNNGSVNDSAVAHGTPPGTTTPIDSLQSDVTVPATQGPALSVVKRAIESSYSAVGDVIHYTFLVTNTGNVLLTDIVVNDQQIAPAGVLDAAPICTLTSLDPGDNTTCTAQYTITQADLDNGHVADSATATGTPPTGTPIVTDPSDVTVPAAQLPTLTVTKMTTLTQFSRVGDVIPYQFKVTNTGNVTLTNISVTDTQTAPAGQLDAPPLCLVTTLKPGENTTCTGQYTVAQADLDNGRVADTAVAHGTPPSGAPVDSPPAELTVPGTQTPGLTLLKSAAEASYAHVGDKLHYSFTVTNTGNVSLKSISVSDSQAAPAGNLDAAPVCPVATLAPGASTVCTATYTVAQIDINYGTVNDSAVAHGTPPSGSPIATKPSDVTVPAVQGPALSILKSAIDTSYSKPGDVIRYSFLVSNTGNVTLTNISVTDKQLAPATQLDAAPVCPVTSLLPGESTICTGAYTVKQADVDNGKISDFATANGTPPSGGPITTTPSEVTVPGNRASSLAIVKTAQVATYAKVGDKIPYEFDVSNTGNTTVTDIVVTDTQTVAAGDLDAPLSCPVTTLAPGAEMTCSGTYTVQQGDLDTGRVTDVAAVDGTSPTGPVHGGPSTVTVPGTSAPALTVEKKATEKTFAKAGDVIHYSFTVTNIGNQTLTGISVTDQQTAPAGSLDGLPDCPVTTLAPGGSTVCTATYTVTQADVDFGKVADAATATGTPPLGTSITTPPSDLTVPGTSAPALTVEKKATEKTFAKAGEVIHYSFKVTNIGNQTLTDISVTDQQTAPAGSLDGLPDCPVTTLAPGGSTVCTATYTVTQADVDFGKVADAATATGTPPSGTSITTPPSDLTVPGTSAPALTVEKKAAETSFATVGNRLHYSFKVTNTGNQTLTGISVTDQQTAPAGSLDGLPDCPVTTLAPGAFTVCTAIYTVTQADLDHGSVNDAAVAHGTPPSGTPITTLPSEVTVPAVQGPALSIVKSATEKTFVKPGDVIHYSFLVSNNGNQTLKSVSVSDVQTAPAGRLDADPVCPVTTLAPGASTTCTATYTVTQADLDKGLVADVAVGHGTPPSGPSVDSSPSDVTVPGTSAPALTVEKKATEKTFAKPGDVIHYTFAVTNTGNVTLKSVSVSDVQTAPAGRLDADPVCPVTTLAPGASTTCTATYTVTQADLDKGLVADVAVGHGTPPSGPSVDSSPSDVTVPGTSAPALTVEKKATEKTFAKPGDVIHYTFAVTNTGNVTLKSVSVSDVQTAPAGRLDADPVCPVTTLAPGASTTCTATYTVTQADLDKGLVADVAVGHGTPPSGPSVDSSPSDVTVPGTSTPALTVEKKAAEASFANVGDKLHYSFKVTNTGNVTLTAISVTDSQTKPAGQLDADPVCPVTALAPGAFTICTAGYTVTQADLNNGLVNDVAVAHGTPPSGPTVDSPKSEVTVPAIQGPALSIVKSATEKSFAKPGDVIHYTFLVSNTGNVTLKAISVTDEQAKPAGQLDADPVCPVTTLAPGASTICTAQYTVTQTDVDHGDVDDVAIAHGTPPSGNPVESNESEWDVPAKHLPGLTVMKKATETTFAKAGDVIHYSFTVTNTGNETLTGISVTDEQAKPAVALDADPACPVTTLAPGESTICTAAYTITQADVDFGKIADTATATGTPPSGPPIDSPPSDVTVPGKSAPAVTIKKTPAETSFDAVGDVIHYSFLVTNTGNVTLKHLSVTDAQTAPAGSLDALPVCPVTSLAPGASTICTGQYTVKQADLDNGLVADVAVAHGTPPVGDPVESSPSDANVPGVQKPLLTIEKSAQETSFAQVGNVLHYAFKVTNTGNVPVGNVSVSDVQSAPAGKLTSGPTCPVTTLAPGASTICTATYTIAQVDLEHGSVHDAATASGTGPQGGKTPPTPPSEVTVPGAQKPALSVVKSAAEKTFEKVGDVIHYSFLVSNTGNVRVTDISVTDVQQAPAGQLTTGPICPAAALDPGKSMVCTGTYSVTQADLDHGQVADSATTTGIDSKGHRLPPSRPSDLVVPGIKPVAPPAGHVSPPAPPVMPNAPLAYTGSPLRTLVFWAAVITLLGIAVLMTGRRRRRSN